MSLEIGDDKFKVEISESFKDHFLKKEIIIDLGSTEISDEEIDYTIKVLEKFRRIKLKERWSCIVQNTIQKLIIYKHERVEE